MKTPTNPKSIGSIVSALTYYSENLVIGKGNTIKKLVVLFTIFLSTSAFAQLAVPFTPRLDGGSIKVKGDVVFIGNNIVTAAGLGLPYNGNQQNNSNEGIYVNVESGGDPDIFSSSSADLTIDTDCKKILYAGLYWASVYPVEVANNQSANFQGTPRFEDWNQIKFKLPTGDFIDLVADNDSDPIGEEDDIIFDGYEYYGAGVQNSFKDSPIICYKNVTNLVQNLTESDGKYTVANLRATRGRRNGGCSAGWTMVVIYESPILPSKYIAVFDGYAGVQGNTDLDIPVSGFQTLPAPYPVNANIGVGALEGDFGIYGDSFRFKASGSTNFTTLSDAINQPNNFFNSTITMNGVHNLNRNPASTNTLGLDINNLKIPNPSNLVIPNDETAGDLKLTTSGDGFGAFVTSFSVEIIEPDIVLTKIVEDEFGNNIGGQVVDLGDELNYVIGFQNLGNDDATDFIIRDILPINIVFDYPNDVISLPPGVSVESYDAATREIIFRIEDYVVEENDPVSEIRFKVTVVESCSLLVDVCSDLINNQAYATYRSVLNPDFLITDDPSYSANTGCLLSPQATNFLADLNDCIFTQNETLCGSTLDITAANGYDSYSWSTSPSGTPVIGTTQTITVNDPGVYYVRNTAVAPCQSIDQIFNVELFGGNIQNPVIPYADEVIICPNDGKPLPNIYLCGANDFRDIETNIASAASIIWDKLDESSCTSVSNPDCANENDSCVWNSVETGSDFTAEEAGQYRLTVNFEGGCFVQFYFNVYQNLLDPSVTTTDIVCDTPGSITVGGVPSGYEYSLDGTNFQSNSTFSITSAGIYTVYIRQVGIETNPCIFTVEDVQVRDRNFTGSTLVIQPFCNGDKGSIQIAANDAIPQYFFELYNGATLVNSVGPIVDNNYTFENLNPGTYTATLETEDGCTYSEEITIIEPPLLTVTAALTAPLACEDGEITIYPQGGTPPYFYFVNSTTDFQTDPIVIVTDPSTYEIMVVDANNCTASTTILVDRILAPEFTVSTSDITCANAGNGGTITINVTNANGSSLQYSVDGGATFINSPVFTGLGEGDHDVVVQYSIGGSVCLTDAQTVTITSTTAIGGTAELTQAFTCATEATITVSTVTGGDAPYTYSIDGINFQNSPDFTGLTSGTYTITIKDANDCTSLSNQVVIDPLNPITDMDFDATALSCPELTSDVSIINVVGGSGTFDYQITAPASAQTAYQSSNVFAGLAPNTYTFRIQDENGCTYSKTLTIAPLPVLTVSTVLTKDLDCTSSPDATINGTISGGTAPFTYAVSVDGGTYTSVGSTGTTFSYSTPNEGTYQFEITDSNGCTVTSGVQTVQEISLPDLSVVTQTQPILCNGDSNGSISVTIDNTVGTAPFTINVTNDTTGVDYGTQTSGLAAGNYTVTVTDAKSCSATENIIIDQPEPIMVNYSTVDISCASGGISQGSIIIDGVTGGTSPYNYFVTGTNGYENSELNTTGSTSVSFDVVDFGLYQINVVDANGCSVLFQDVLVASPPTDLDINIDTTVDCLTGGEAVVSVGSSLASAGPFFFSIYQGPVSVYPNPAGSWIAEDAPGSQSATFTGLTPGVQYTFIVYDAATDCSYYEPSTAPIPTNSTLTATAVSANNITCNGSDDGNVSFTVNSVYAAPATVSYEIFESLSLETTGISGTGVVPSNGALNVTNLGALPFGNYYVLITETVGPNTGCSVVSVPFNITESALPLELTASVDNNANCVDNSGLISAVAQFGTAPYQYQVTTSATAPLASDTNWANASTFNLNAGNYYVHVIDAYGCIVTSPVQVLPMDPAPSISAVTNNQCTVEDGAYAIDVTLDVAGIAPYSYSIDGGAFQTQTAPFTISNLVSGTHTVEVQDANGCGNLVSIDVVAPLDMVPAVTAFPSCNDNDGEITLIGSGGSGSYTYSINPSATSISFSGSSFTGVPSGDYVVTMTDDLTACTEDVSITIPSANPLTFTLTPTTVICFGEDAPFEINVSGYTGAYTYEVFNTAGTSVTGSVIANTTTNPLTVSGVPAGTYTVELTETDAPFCSATASLIINSPSETLALDLTESSNVTCSDDQGTITAVATGGWGDVEYELTGASTVGYSSNGTFTGLSAGTYTVNAMDSGGCIASGTITLEVPLPIDATFTASTGTLLCFGDQDASITVSNVSGGQGSNYTYTLNTVLPTASTSGPQTLNVFTDLAAGTYSVVINDGYGCSRTSADIVIGAPTPITASLVTATAQTCLIDAELTLSASGGTGAYQYSDDSGFATVLGTFTASATFDVAPGTYSYYVRDANGCVATVSNEITIEQIPALELELELVNATINCAGDNTGAIIATATGGLGDYVYILQDGSGVEITDAVQNSPGVFTGLVAGDYIVLVESGDCSDGSLPVSITEPDAPLEVSFEVSNISCPGTNNGAVEITATGGTGTVQYAISPQLNQFFSTNTFVDLSPGTYDVIVQDQLGCYVTFDFTVTEPAPVILGIVADSFFPEICFGEANGEFSVEISGGVKPYSVSLDDYNGVYTQGSATQAQFDFTDLVGGDHVVFVRDSNGCESEWNISFPGSVRIEAEVEVSFSCDNNNAVNAVTVMVDGTLTDTAELDYSLDGGPYQMSNVFTDVPTGGDHYVDVRHTNGCIVTTKFFEIPEFEPLALVLEEGELNEIVAVATGGTGDYEFWLNGESQGDNNVFTIYETGTYNITVTDGSGCDRSESMEYEFVDICIPNYFTPNGDGIQDGWAPGCSNGYPNLEFDIFDRYGRKVASLRQGELWDGRYNGNELPTGDYWYVVSPNSTTSDREFVGNFTLYR
ncbi:T9SS type B sorting domain-containing protein [Sediminibacter sp. Hel_I_10]|uniref:T9SS type B sorting domain-containing protein n=1 Tax=Sediminibacter sp. Hel_I_10 TaxID=1392490 RepID=UPI0009DCA386|nr:T9SS type B sorting domain-containing protein [Sediminibacter sp. Hel_I_10]